MTREEKRMAFIAAFTHHMVLTMDRSVPLVTDALEKLDDVGRSQFYEEYLIGLAEAAKTVATVVVDALNDALKEGMKEGIV